MSAATTQAARSPTLRRRCCVFAALFFNSRRLAMTWETPSATDFRFGFEITMYIAAR